ncbi:MAG: acetamidase/formamidase family protein [Bacillota bacterium]
MWIWRLEEGEDGPCLYSEDLRVRVPSRPFMGTFSVAPELEAISSLTPGPFGGNMDVPDVRLGNTVFLPVSNPGALFYTGDCHGNQGQGEACGVVLKISCKVTVVFDVVKEKKIAWPRIESSDAAMVVGSARPIGCRPHRLYRNHSLDGGGVRVLSLGGLPALHPGGRFMLETSWTPTTLSWRLCPRGI